VLVAPAFSFGRCKLSGVSIHGRNLKMIRTLLVAIFVGCVFVAGCRHAEPEITVPAPVAIPSPSLPEARDARNQAINALFYCAAQYATDNARVYGNGSRNRGRLD
jgi:hypothetical protein